MHIRTSIYMSSLVIFLPVLASIEVDRDTFAILNEGYDFSTVSVGKKDTRDGAQSMVTFITDGKGRAFVVKQAKVMDSEKALLLTMRDMLGCYIAEYCNLPANRVRLIPRYKDIPGKMIKDMPGTIHLIVPGKPVASFPDSFRKNLSIKQVMSPRTPQKNWGLTRKIITNMSRHKDLCTIVGMDTFMGCNDRHLNNFFYDASADRFYAIDLQSTFSKNMAFYACRMIQSLLDGEGEALTTAELKALKIYKETIEMLIEYFPPEKLYEKKFEFIRQGQYRVRELIASVLKTRTAQGDQIKENYDSCKQLIPLLKQLLARYQFRG